MAALADFTRHVRPEVPGCPEIQILDAVLHAGIEFCKRTKIMRETVTIETVADTARYDLTDELVDGAEPDEVMNVSRGNNIDLSPSSEQDFLANGLEDSGTPQYFYLDGNDLVLGLKPSAAETLTVTVKARPTEAATTLPDELYRRYRLEIAAGAKAFLMLMDKQPWTNLQQAAIHSAAFNLAVDTENLRYATGGGSKPLRTVAQFM
jgi:hypothetical protein